MIVVGLVIVGIALLVAILSSVGARKQLSTRTPTEPPQVDSLPKPRDLPGDESVRNG